MLDLPKESILFSVPPSRWELYQNWEHICDSIVLISSFAAKSVTLVKSSYFIHCLFNFISFLPLFFNGLHTVISILRFLRMVHRRSPFIQLSNDIFHFVPLSIFDIPVSFLLITFPLNLVYISILTLAGFYLHFFDLQAFLKNW